MLAYGDVVFGPHARHRYDVHLPSGTPPAGGWPWFLWVHGGGWWQGDKTDKLQLPEAGFPYGLAFVSTNYRLSGDGAYPQHIADVLAALRHVRANAAAYGLHPEKVGLWGNSAGAHLALVAAMATGQAPGYSALRYDMQDHLDQSEAVLACAAWFPPTTPNKVDADFTAQVAEFGYGNQRGYAICSTQSQEAWLLGGQATPLNPCQASAAVHNAATPRRWALDAVLPLPAFRIEHGVRANGVGGDGVVPVGQSRRIRDTLQAEGASVTYLERPGFRHGGPEWQVSAHDETAAWLAAALGG